MDALRKLARWLLHLVGRRSKFNSNTYVCVSSSFAYVDRQAGRHTPPVSEISSRTRMLHLPVHVRPVDELKIVKTDKLGMLKPNGAAPGRPTNRPLPPQLSAENWSCSLLAEMCEDLIKACVKNPPRFIPRKSLTD
ncbi:hypothetical protein T06_15570 [Trichinella sp. T6]|nr:hypothetical protein T06_15570 [Trichinella sp. T6]